jgi:hypothetical protein
MEVAAKGGVDITKGPQITNPERPYQQLTAGEEIDE